MPRCTFSDAARLATEALSGVHAAIALAVERKQAMTRAQVKYYAAKLRKAADELERCL